MASISTDAQGRKTLQFVALDRRRKTIRLGAVSDDEAQTFKAHVDHLLECARADRPWSQRTERWLAELMEDEKGRERADRLAEAGLLPETFLRPEERRDALGAFLDAYIAGRVDLKPSTRSLLERAKEELIGYFGADKPLGRITPGDADGFRLALLQKGLAENTVRRRCGRAKQFFKAAMRQELIDRNPFADVKSSVKANRARFYFVTRAEAEKVIAACPAAEWRLLVALSRYGGMRCPSETLSLKWEHVLWEQNRITVPSPKTEHHDGGAWRVIPLFPELRPHLEEVFELARPGAVYVISRYRGGGVNLRTQLERIIRRAGLIPWEKPWQNMRSSRETELAESYPMHVVTRWIGNSEPVATEHYLQVTEDHFARAVGGESAARCTARCTNTEVSRRKGSSEATSPRFSQEKRGLTPSYDSEAPPARGERSPWGTVSLTTPPRRAFFMAGAAAGLRAVRRPHSFRNPKSAIA